MKNLSVHNFCSLEFFKPTHVITKYKRRPRVKFQLDISTNYEGIFDLLEETCKLKRHKELNVINLTTYTGSHNYR